MKLKYDQSCWLCEFTNNNNFNSSTVQFYILVNLTVEEKEKLNDKKHETTSAQTIENCMVHMHKHHGFFIPDVEYLKDPKGLLTYLGLKV